MDLSRLLLAGGDRASACGRVVTAGEETWFEPPLPSRAVMHPPGGEPAPRPSGVGVRVEGVDSEGLDERREKDGAVEGWACLTGRWLEDRLGVEEQRPWAPRLTSETAAWDVPPCEPPPGGWPLGAASERLRDQLDGPEVVSVTIFHPRAGHEVVVVASGDPPLTRRRLEPVAGGRLCVVESRWSRDQVRAVREALHDHVDEWALYSSGQTSTASGQAQLHVEVVRVLPAFATFAAGVPEEMLVVEPWLVPFAG